MTHRCPRKPGGIRALVHARPGGRRTAGRSVEAGPGRVGGYARLTGSSKGAIRAVTVCRSVPGSSRHVHGCTRWCRIVVTIHVRSGGYVTSVYTDGCPHGSASLVSRLAIPTPTQVRPTMVPVRTWVRAGLPESPQHAPPPRQNSPAE